MRVAEILALAGHRVEFLPESIHKTPDIRLDGIEFEIKSPITNKTEKIERNIKRALKQSDNIIIDSSRIRNYQEQRILGYLTQKARTQKQIHRLIFITKNGQIIDIKMPN